MKRIKYLIFALTCVALSSCGIFHKDCGCPHFSKIVVERTAQQLG